MRAAYVNFLKESINILEKKIFKSMCFIDVVKSSEKWNKNPKEMSSILEEFSEIISEKVKSHNGLIAKSIGDAFMISFDSLSNSLNFSIELQEKFKESPLEIKGSPLITRIGICAGMVYEAKTELQGKELKDYLGNVVNTASRVESEVCENGDVAFTFTDEDQIDYSEIENIIGIYDIDLVSYTNMGKEVKRSSRILNNIQRHHFEDIEDLKGIKEIDVYKIKL